MLATLSQTAILRILRSMLAAELEQGSRRMVPPATQAAWDGSLQFGPAGLGLDSLERLALSSAVNQFFQIHEVGIEDMLLSRDSLGRWAELVAIALAEGTSGLTFRTSGSGGEPKPCPQSKAVLEAETEHWAHRFADRRRIVQLVPAHHIYGCLFTALLPDRLGLPVLDARALSPGKLQRELAAGDLLVGFPFGFRRLLAELPALPPGLRATSSTAPLPPETHAALLDRGIEQVLQIYGSSETSGIATRTRPDEPFHLLPRWRAGAGGEAASVIEVATDAVQLLPDRAEWLADGRLRLLGRKDDAVQVGGVNVFPEAVAALIRDHAGVAACAVRLDTSLVDPRLKAFVVPSPGADPAVLAEALDCWCRATLSAPNRPVHLTFGAALPRNSMGKLSDWDRMPELQITTDSNSGVNA